MSQFDLVSAEQPARKPRPPSTLFWWFFLFFWGIYIVQVWNGHYATRDLDLATATAYEIVTYYQNPYAESIARIIPAAILAGVLAIPIDLIRRALWRRRHKAQA